MIVSNPSGAALRSGIVTFTRDMTALNGDVSYTGLGFSPRALVLLGVLSNDFNSIGIGAEGGAEAALYRHLSVATIKWAIDTTLIARIFRVEATPDVLNVNLVSLDSDGFTLHYDKGTNAAGTATFEVLCLGLQ